MKIGIDARFIGPEGTGLGKYTEKLIENLQKIDKVNTYCIFLRQTNWHFLKLQNSNFKKVLADINWYSLQEQLKMAGIFNSQNLDLLHVPHFNVPILYRKKFIVTIHDLIHHNFPQESATTKNPLVYKLKRGAYKFTIGNAIKKSVKIITPSNHVKNELVDTFKINQSKISVIYEAAEEEYQKAPASKPENLLKKYKIRKPYLIYVGNAYPHKNLETLFAAIKIINHKTKLNLVVVTARNVFSKRLEAQIAKNNLEKNVQVTPYIQSAELNTIIRSSQAYIFPSLSEGFGIPGLNAMAAGVPVLASNIPTLKEIYQDAALYFDPKNPTDIANNVNTLLKSPKTKGELVKKGFTQVKKYSWQKMAEETLKVYECAK